MDPVVDALGHDPRGWYFERYWLSVIGPTATMLMRRIADRFDEHPDGFILDLGHCASTMGLSFRRGAGSPFGRAVQRCAMFGLARQVSTGFAVRRWAPQVAQRHLERLPADVRANHSRFVASRSTIDARALTTKLRNAGVPIEVARRAADATRWAS